MAEANPPKSRLYTRTGDKGLTSLYSGDRVSKTHPIIEALGTLDELNSSIGIAHYYCEQAGNGLADQLKQIQQRIFEIGASVATPAASSSEVKQERTNFDGNWLRFLERWVDEVDAQNPPLRQFILPSGGESAIFLHQCRSVCRRAERLLVLVNEESALSPDVLKYVNRLSDYFFAAARRAAHYDQKVETVFVGNEKAPVDE
ncbi:hypothetical protein IWQ62_005513 [Dispira parvispora]|uniref:Corrinoid adenosyltransferase MMAB n=1 Tax=Dispira parvispora TaxID=1520584 RepID=A0A9W8AIN2_9FUNG|nr:hypothetical protein IWQ62_005513 [Dispira parvispora]